MGEIGRLTFLAPALIPDIPYRLEFWRNSQVKFSILRLVYEVSVKLVSLLNRSVFGGFGLGLKLKFR
jgi:hypothetical protein